MFSLNNHLRYLARVFIHKIHTIVDGLIYLLNTFMSYVLFWHLTLKPSIINLSILRLWELTLYLILYIVFLDYLTRVFICVAVGS